MSSMTLQLLARKRISSKTASPIGSLRPELDLLLCCARTHIDPATSAQIQNLLQKELDWAYLLQKACQHGVFLLLYESLQKTHPELIPQTISHQLHAYCQIKTARNLFLAKELWQILDLLATHNISSILATLAYGNLALREFCDLDILVRKDDFLRAKELLKSQGYCQKQSPEHEAACAQAQLVRYDGKVKIDLHYDLVPKDFFFSLNSEPFWLRLQLSSIAGQPVATFSPEDTLLVAYIHGSKEKWTYLKRVCDLAELTRTYPKINWEQILDKVNLLGNERGFLSGLVLAHNHLKIPFPEIIYQKVKDLPHLQFLAEQHYKQLVCEAELKSPLTRIGGLSSFQIVSTDSLWVRMQYCLDVALRVNEKDRAFLPLPTFLSFLYYPLRLLRLTKTYKLGLDKILNLWKLLTSG